MSLVKVGSPRGRAATVSVKRPGERRSRSGSATRALDVLELFGRLRAPLRAVEISRALGLHPSTTNQLLKTMVESAHLVFDARAKSYLPSPRLAEFSAWIAEIYGAGGGLRELVTEIQDRTGLVATVTTQNDLFMQVIEIAASESQRGERGLQVSLFGSAIGSAYLSMLDDAEVIRLAGRARVPEAELATVLATVGEIRREGFADGASTDETFWSIAMPLPVRGARVPAVLGLAGASEPVRGRRDELCRIMRQAIERWAGASDPA